MMVRFKLFSHLDIPDYVDPTQRYQIAAMKVA